MTPSAPTTTLALYRLPSCISTTGPAQRLSVCPSLVRCGGHNPGHFTGYCPSTRHSPCAARKPEISLPSGHYVTRGVPLSLGAGLQLGTPAALRTA